jgi:hypothetical protein
MKNLVLALAAFVATLPAAAAEPAPAFRDFDEDGKIVSDVAATGIAGILQGIAPAPADQ